MENINNEISENLSESSPNRIEKQKDYSPNNPPWGIIVALLVFVASIVLTVALPQIMLLPYLLVKRVKLPEGQDALQFILSDPIAVGILLGATFLAHIIIMIIAWLVVTEFKKHSFTKMLGWKSGGFKLWHGAVILIAVYAFALGMANLFGSQENEMTKLLKSSRTAVYLVAFLATFSAPIVEEVVYRGILYSAFQRTAGTPIGSLIKRVFAQQRAHRIVSWIDKFSLLKSLKTNIERIQTKYSISIAVFAVTIIFALIHVPQYYPDAATIISILVLSLVITLIRVKTDNLLPCIAFHFVFNGVQSILLILQPYLPKAIDPLEVESAFFWLLR